MSIFLKQNAEVWTDFDFSNVSLRGLFLRGLLLKQFRNFSSVHWPGPLLPGEAAPAHFVTN